MIKSKLWMLSILLSMLFIIVSCKKDSDNEPQPQPQPVNEAQVLVEFLESANCPYMKDYVNTDMPSIMPASEVKTLMATDQIYIIDIRSATDFAAGHIEGAHNVAFEEVLNHVSGLDLSQYTKVAVVCYTGQTAGYATTLLRVMGYEKAFSMKWGMCSWHVDFATSWQSSIANTYATQFTADATAKGAAGALPTLSTGKTSGLDILNARIATIFTEGFTPAKITAQAVFDNLANYYVVNYWPEGQYTNPGHIPGAMQYTPKASMKLADALTTLPTDKTIAVYCYTGQTSAFLTAYLRLLGYDAKSILYGSNTMIYDVMVGMGMTVFNNDQIMGYDYVTN